MSFTTPNPPVHLQYPFRFTAASGAATVDQGSFDDVLSCVRAIVACPVGACPELPTFGIPDPTFLSAPPSGGALIAAIQQWEPRAEESAVVSALDNSGGAWAISLSTQVTGTGQ
jgi:hypothetical protein